MKRTNLVSFNEKNTNQFIGLIKLKMNTGGSLEHTLNPYHPTW
jgi:hypothetical protein